MEPERVQPLRGRVNLRVITMKVNPTFPKVLGLEPLY